MLRPVCVLTVVLGALLLTANNARSADRPVAKIVNGVPTQAFPSVGLLLFVDEKGGFSTSCTATLIGCETALTAAHCFCGTDFSGQECVRSGEAEWRRGRTVLLLQHGGAFPIREVSIHPDYRFPLSGDLAILKLDGIASGVPPASINTQRQVSTGSQGTIVGFGETGGGRGDTGVKRLGRVTTSRCIDPRDGKVKEGWICWEFDSAIGPSGEDSDNCHGDSGGPLFVDLGLGIRLAGVTSGNFPGTCVPPSLSFDADVYRYRAWITQQAGQDLNRNRCDGVPQVGDDTVRTRVFSGSLSAAAPAQTYTVEVEPGARNLRFVLNGMDESRGVPSEIDLLVRFGTAPTGSHEDDCIIAAPGPFGVCAGSDPTPGTWYVTAARRAGAGDYQITVTTIYGENPPSPTFTPTVTPTPPAPASTATLTRVSTATRFPTSSATRTRSWTATMTPSRTPTAPAPPTVTASPSAYRTPTRTPTRTASSTPRASPTLGPCRGDCSGDGTVTINEIILGVRIALDDAEPTSCGAWMLEPGQTVRIDMLIAAIASSMNGCLAPPSRTPTPTAPPSAAPTNPVPPLTPTASPRPTPAETAISPTIATLTPTMLPTASPSPTPTVAPAPFLRAYVTNGDSNSVSVVDLSGREVVATIEGFDRPVAVAARPDGRFVYVVNQGRGTLSVVDTIAGRIVGEVSVGTAPHGVDVTPDGHLGFVSAQTTGGDVTVVDLDHMLAVDTVLLSTAGGAVKVHPNAQKVYVAAANDVVVFQVETHQVIARLPFPADSTVTDIEFIPGGNYGYAVTSPNNEAGIISGTGDNLLTRFQLGGPGNGADGIGDVPFTTFLFATQGAAGRIAVIERSLSWDGVVGTIDVDGIPVDVAAPDSFSAFVTVTDPEGGAGWLAVLNPVTRLQEQTIGPLGRGALAIAIARFDGDPSMPPTSTPSIPATRTPTETPEETASPTASVTSTSTVTPLPTQTPTCRAPSTPSEIGTGRLTSSANVGSNEVELSEMRVRLDVVDACTLYRASASLRVAGSPPCFEPRCEQFITARIASDMGGGAQRTVQVSTNLNQPSTVVVDAEFAGLAPGPHWISVFVKPNSSGPTFFAVPSSLRVTAE